MKSHIATWILLLIIDFDTAQGCTPHASRRKRDLSALEVPSRLSDFFSKCLKKVDKEYDLFESLRSNVDYVIRDTNWYHEVSLEIPETTADSEEYQYWIDSLPQLLKDNSILYSATEKCICRWDREENGGDCPEHKRRKRAIEHTSNPFKSGHSSKSCIDVASQKFLNQYPSLVNISSDSIYQFLVDHYTDERSDTVKHRTRRAESSFPPRRRNIDELFSVATRKDGPLWASYQSCQASTKQFSRSEECSSGLIRTNTVECVVTHGSVSYEVGVDECSEHKDCCVLYGECVVIPKDTKATDQNVWQARNQLFRSAVKAQLHAEDEAEVQSRSLGFPPGLPGIPSACYPPAPFPANCKISRSEPYILEPPVDIPYCVRIPCRSPNNAPYDKNLKLCGSQAGCYFDQALFEYREAFGPSVLPGVPVCHLAIRNKFFQQKSIDVKAKYGLWNPYFTNCLLTQFDGEIRPGPKGCELLPILDTFYVTPKMAGWKTINSYECALINGCWRPGRGCFYPIDISQVRVKSGQREITFQRNEIIYGRPRCQVFDTSSPLNILKSYHRCLSSGCTVDSSVTNLYYNHLYQLGSGLTSENHWKFWSDVERGHVGAYNIEAVLGEYGYGGPSPPSTTAPPPPPTPSDPFAGDLFNFGGSGPFGAPPSSGGSSLPFAPPPQVANTGCGPAFAQYGGRPCEPPKFAVRKPSKHCPYKPFFVPRFPKLTGKFDGCCDINLCYLPKSEISKMHSGPSLYYTEWSLYSECSATCGPGEQKRYRRCISDEKGKCTKKLVETKLCFKQCSSWTPWSGYTPCPNSCYPGGIQTRTRKCLPPYGHCPGSAEHTRECNRQTPCWG